MLERVEIETGLMSLLKVNMGYKPEESVLILNDIPLKEEWSASWNSVLDYLKRSLMARLSYEILKEKLPGKAHYYVYPMLRQSGMEPPQVVAQELLKYDVILAMTSRSLSHTNARKNAADKGARIASMPGILPEMLSSSGPLAVDYEKIKEETLRLAKLLTVASSARVLTEEGTSITLSLEGRTGEADTGLYLKPGEWGNLPGGEAYIAPVEGSAQGKIVVPAGWGHNLTQDLMLVFEEGYVVECRGGGPAGDRLRGLLDFSDPKLKHRRNCAELGVGTNPRARRPDIVLEAEKIKGTVHIAVGDNLHMGGNTESDLHTDFVIPRPTLIVDGEVIIERGDPGRLSEKTR